MDLITATFGQLCCFCCMRRKHDDEPDSDIETDEGAERALAKARRWREVRANAEHGGKPPAYRPTEGMRGPDVNAAGT